MTPKLKISKPKFVTMCSDCGMPITKEQLGLAIPDTYLPDYDEREEVIISLNFCVGCWKRIKANHKGGMKKAMQKYRESQVVEQSMKEAFNRRNGE